MFIKKPQRPWIEFNAEDGQQAPTLVHYYSDRCDPFKTVLPHLISGAGGDEEQVFIVESPLAELIDETIGLHRDPDWKDRVVVDERHRAFFAAVRLSLTKVIEKIDGIEFATLDDQDDDEG